MWKTVAGIGHGRVRSYGEVARATGYPRHARQVSIAMSRSADPLPWYRVVRSDRSLAFEVGSQSWKRQKSLLEAEGVEFSDGRIIGQAVATADDFDAMLWAPED